MRRLLPALTAPLLIHLACARPDGLGRPGHAASSASAAELGGRVPSNRQPTDSELSSAFEGSGSGSRTRGGLERNVPLLAEPQDPDEAERRSIEEELARLRQRVKSNDDAALSEANSLVARARKLDSPELELRARELQVDAALRRRDKRVAELGRQWLHACGPGAIDACRKKALGRMVRARAEISDVQKADACLKEAEVSARQGTVPACLEAAENQYRQDGDLLMLARARLTRAKTPGEFQRAATTCKERRCADVRRRALQRWAAHSLEEGDPESAATAALTDVALNAETLAPGRRPWAWTELATRTCKALDDARGTGRCRKLERELTGANHFWDFSVSPTHPDGLPSERVREVNAHYGFTLQPCLEEQAKRLVPPDEERYQISWIVLNDGTVATLNMDRRDRENSPLAQCLRQQLSQWRYPRYEGELQHVEQQFLVSARMALRSF